MKKAKRYFRFLKMVVYVVLPIVLLVLPASFFDHGKSLCLSSLLFDVECPGCGSVRAFMHLIHFEFKAAYSYNMLSFITFPIIAFLWAKEFVKEFKYFTRKKMPAQQTA